MVPNSTKCFHQVILVDDDSKMKILDSEIIDTSPDACGAATNENGGNF